MIYEKIENFNNRGRMRRAIFDFLALLVFVSALISLLCFAAVAFGPVYYG